MTARVGTVLVGAIRRQLDRGEALADIEFLSGERGEVLRAEPQADGSIRLTYRLREVHA